MSELMLVQYIPLPPPHASAKKQGILFYFKK